MVQRLGVSAQPIGRRLDTALVFLERLEEFIVHLSLIGLPLHDLLQLEFEQLDALLQNSFLLLVDPILPAVLFGDLFELVLQISSIL